MARLHVARLPISTSAWALAVAASLVLHLRAAYAGPAWLVYVFKPLTTTLILVMALVAWRRGGAAVPERRYAAFVCAGLVCSLAGDVLLIAPERFVAGLVAFLVAHVCYVAAFTVGRGLTGRWRVGLPFALYLGVLLGVLLPRAGGLALPVTVYGLTLCVMAWQASERWTGLRTPAAASAAGGAVLFVISDSALAINRFAVPFRLSTVVVMTTYIAAQWLIAKSIARMR